MKVSSILGTTSAPDANLSRDINTSPPSDFAPIPVAFSTNVSTRHQINPLTAITCNIAFYRLTRWLCGNCCGCSSRISIAQTPIVSYAVTAWPVILNARLISDLFEYVHRTMSETQTKMITKISTRKRQPINGMLGAPKLGMNALTSYLPGTSLCVNSVRMYHRSYKRSVQPSAMGCSHRFCCCCSFSIWDCLCGFIIGGSN